jgi:hypothetical protein
MKTNLEASHVLLVVNIDMIEEKKMPSLYLTSHSIKPTLQQAPQHPTNEKTKSVSPPMIRPVANPVIT